MAKFAILRKAKIDGRERLPGESIELSQSRGDWLVQQGIVRALDPPAALLRPKTAGRSRRCCGW